MALTLNRKVVKNDKKERIGVYGKLKSIKAEQFINSCEYDMKEGDVQALAFRVRRFLEKNEELEQMVLEGLFAKVWNPDKEPILHWLLERMDKKTLEHALQKLGKSDIVDEEDECKNDLFNFDPWEFNYDDEEGDDSDGEDDDFDWDEFERLEE